MVQQSMPSSKSIAFVRSLDGLVLFSLPAAWQILTLADFADSAVQADAEAMTIRALQFPMGAPEFEAGLTADSTVCILIEDLTRSSPKKTVLKVVLDNLKRIGIPAGNISVVIALGTHRPLSRRELENGFGPETVAEYRFFNHDCHAADLMPIGLLASGAEVKINRLAYAADFRIGIGSIFPHPLNGFGGGGKILFPGVADFHSIFEHHLCHSFRGNSSLGVLTGNEFHDEVTSMALAGRLDFIVNSVLDHNDRLHQVVAGDPVLAHQAGAAICRSIISRDFHDKSDVTIISAFPYSEGPQIMKPLAPAEMITRPGGIVILCADCRTPLPEAYFAACESFRANHGGDLRRAVLDHFAAGRPIMEGAPPELNMSMAQVMLGQNDFKVILVTKDIPALSVARLGFRHAADLQEAIAIAGESLARPTVNIVPAGGVILPVISKISPLSR